MQDKAQNYVTAYTDEHGVKHIAPYYFKYRSIHNKRKNEVCAQQKHRQWEEFHEYSYKRK